MKFSHVSLIAVPFQMKIFDILHLLPDETEI